MLGANRNDTTPLLLIEDEQNSDEIQAFSQLLKACGDPLRVRRMALEKRLREQTEAVVKPFDGDLRTAGLAVVTIEEGNAAGHSAIFPLVNDEAMAPEEYEELHRKGKISDDGFAEYQRLLEDFRDRFASVTSQVHEIRRTFQKALQALVETDIHYR